RAGLTENRRRRFPALQPRKASPPGGDGALASGTLRTMSSGSPSVPSSSGTIRICGKLAQLRHGEEDARFHRRYRSADDRRDFLVAEIFLHTQPEDHPLLRRQRFHPVLDDRAPLAAEQDAVGGGTHAP